MWTYWSAAFESGFRCVDQAGLELAVFFLHWSPNAGLAGLSHRDLKHGEGPGSDGSSGDGVLPHS